MKFAIILGVFFFVANAYANKDGEECVKMAFKVVSNETADIGDFHGKSEMAKMKILHKEAEKMMEDGNKAWKTYARMYKVMEEEFGGQDTFLETYVANYTKNLTSGVFDSEWVCRVLEYTEPYYKQTKKSMGKSLGASDKFMGMVKDMMTIDFEHKNIKDASTVFFALGYLYRFGMIDETIEMVSHILDMVPEESFRKNIRVKGPILY